MRKDERVFLKLNISIYFYVLWNSKYFILMVFLMTNNCLLKSIYGMKKK